MKQLLGKVKTVKVPFMDETVEVTRLTVAQVKEFQKELNAVKLDDADDEGGLKIQRTIVRMGVVGAADLTDEELDSFPLVELTKLVQEILKLAGVSGAAEGNASAKKS